MCKYSYVSGACANRRVESVHCIGEEDCEFSQTNIMEQAAEVNSDSLGGDWHQLYCATHGRYLCSKTRDCPQPRSTQKHRTHTHQRKLVDDWRGIW